MVNRNTSQGRSVHIRMQSAKTAIKLDISASYARPRKELNREPILFKCPQDDDDTLINENGVGQPNPPRVNMLKLVNHIEADKGGKHLKFPIASHPKRPYKHHIGVRVDTGADVNCMNEKTFNELFPEVQLSVCSHEIQNFGNSVADISIPGQFLTYLEFRGEKYLNTLIVTNANDCPNLLSHAATFRMGVLLPNYPEENVVKGDNVPNFSKMNGGRTGNGNHMVRRTVSPMSTQGAVHQMVCQTCSKS